VRRTLISMHCLMAGLLLAGCVTVDPDAKFPDVQQEADERLGMRVQWRLGGDGGDDDRQADAFVDDLLSRPLTPESAVQVSLLRSRDLQAVYEDLGVAQADLVQAGLLTNPDLAGFLRFPDSGPSGANWNVGLDFWLGIFVIPLRKKIAGSELDAAILRVTDAVLDKATRVRHAYFMHLADLRTLDRARALVEFADVAAELSERQRAQGHIRDLDLANERAAEEEARLALDRAEAAARISREALRRLLELTDSDVPWTIDESFAAIPPADLDVEALVATSLDRRVDLALLGQQIQTQRLGLELDKKWFLTNGTIGAETERSSGGVQGTGPHISVELPIFHQHQAIYARREAFIRQAEQRLAAQRGVARTDVRIAAQRMSLARRTADRFERSLIPVRRQIVGLTQAEYSAMFVGVLDLLTAKEAETRAAIDHARAVQDYWTARADLERAVGIRLPDLPATQEPAPAPPPETPAPPPSLHEGHGGDR